MSETVSGPAGTLLRLIAEAEKAKAEGRAVEKGPLSEALMQVNRGWVRSTDAGEEHFGWGEPDGDDVSRYLAGEAERIIAKRGRGESKPDHLRTLRDMDLFFSVGRYLRAGESYTDAMTYAGTDVMHYTGVDLSLRTIRRIVKDQLVDAVGKHLKIGDSLSVAIDCVGKRWGGDHGIPIIHKIVEKNFPRSPLSPPMGKALEIRNVRTTPNIVEGYVYIDKDGKVVYVGESWIGKMIKKPARALDRIARPEEGQKYLEVLEKQLSGTAIVAVWRD